LEFEKTSFGVRIFCLLHHAGVCSCGHETKARPGEDAISITEGRMKDIKLAEYVQIK
jgi:hypothetical protein